MIVRLVKMVFREEEVDRFKSFIAERAPRIRAFDGCEFLQIVQDQRDPGVIFTYSHWIDEPSLERYRHSELFQQVWTFTKSLFAAKAEAWSTDRFIEHP